MSRLFISTLLLLLAGRACSQQHSLYLSGWKKHKEVQVKTGDHVLITVKEMVNDSLPVSVEYTGIVKSFSDTSLSLKVYKLHYTGYIQTYTKLDTAILPEHSFSFTNISRFTFSKDIKKSDRLETIVSSTSIAIIFLAPVASVNHAHGTFSRGAFWIIIGAGYLIPMTTMAIIDSHYSTYLISAAKPEKPGKWDYKFKMK